MTDKKVLRDHKQRGKVLIPPFTHMLGPMQEVSWVKTILPELLWIALIQDCHGHHEGVKLITSMSRTARKCVSSSKLMIFGDIGSYGDLTLDEKGCIRTALSTTGELIKLQKAVLPLVAFYPKCLLEFIFDQKPTVEVHCDDILKYLRKNVEDLYDRALRKTMMVQATFIWLAFDSDVLKVAEGLALAKFPEIENYPYTELSKQVASSIRAGINVFFGKGSPYYPEVPEWPRYFWNRGLEIDHCYHFEDKSE